MPLMTPKMIEAVFGEGWVKTVIGYQPAVTSLMAACLINRGPMPHKVEYSASHDKAFHVAPEEFYMGAVPCCASDCTWIVPGTGQ